MIKRQLTRTVFAASLLIAFSMSARAEVVQCIDDTGAITFTDLPCNADANAVPVPDSIKTPTVATKAGSHGGDLAAAEQARTAALAIKQRQKRGLAIDAATMEAAKLSLIAKDREAALARQQAMDQPRNKPVATRVFSLVGYL